MPDFNAHKWFKKQYLAEAGLNEEKSKNERIFDLFYDELEDFDNVAMYLKRYKKMIMNRLDSIDFDYLPKPPMVGEEISDYEMVVYKVEGITADTDEGGPDEPFEMEVKLDASLSSEEVKTAIRDAARREQGRLYKLDYKKA